MCAALWFFAQELDRLNSVAADESAEDLRRDFSGRLSDAECSVEGDRKKILEEVQISGHEILGVSHFSHPNGPDLVLTQKSHAFWHVQLKKGTSTFMIGCFFLSNGLGI